MSKLPEVSALTPVEDNDPSADPVIHLVPQWVEDCGDFEFGVMIDDHCFVVLVRAGWDDEWVKATHIPWQAARKLGQLAESVSP